MSIVTLSGSLWCRKARAACQLAGAPAPSSYRDGGVLVKICGLLLLLRLRVLQHIPQHARSECENYGVAVQLFAIRKAEAHKALVAARHQLAAPAWRTASGSLKLIDCCTDMFAD